MRVQSGIKSGTVLRSAVVGSHPIIETFIEKLKIQETISSYIKQDERMKLGIEHTLKLVIHNILTSPLPLYEISDWLKPLDEKALGIDGLGIERMDDDRIGRALEIFYHGRHKDVFFRLALRAIKVFKIDCSYIHQDTTTVTFSGKYAGWTAREFLTYGFNKDHRPDLKQLVLGTSATADGAVPLVHQVYDGNQTDDRLHPENHERLRRLLGRSDFVYVADSKLASEGNLSKIVACGGRFVTVMPRTWEEDSLFRGWVREGKIQWDLVLSKKNNRHSGSKGDQYYVAKGEYRAKGHRLIWIYSTQKGEQDIQTRTRHIEQALEDLRALQGRLNSYHLKTRKEINERVKRILAKQASQRWIQYEIHEHEQYHIKHSRRGRPKTSREGRKIKSPFFSLSFGTDDEAIKQEALTDGIFPLITSETDSPKRILEIYKFQPFLEKRHSQLKTWQEITPVLLKKGERVVALLHMHVMALMVATLIERKLRLAMKAHSLRSLPIYPEAKPCKYPTMFDVVRLFKEVARYEVQTKHESLVFPVQLNRTQRLVLKLLDVPIALYQ